MFKDNRDYSTLDVNRYNDYKYFLVLPQKEQTMIIHVLYTYYCIFAMLGIVKLVNKYKLFLNLDLFEELEVYERGCGCINDKYRKSGTFLNMFFTKRPLFLTTSPLSKIF